jgi:hypothetical protein
MIISLLIYTLIANTIIIIITIKAIPPSNILTTIQRPIISFITHTFKGREEARYTIIKAKKTGHTDLWDRAIPSIMGSSGKMKKMQKTINSQARINTFNRPKKNKSKFSFNPYFLEYILT